MTIDRRFKGERFNLSILNNITWTINRRKAIGHTPQIAESINLDIDSLSLKLTSL